MKLIRFGNPGEEKPGVINENNQKIDVSNFGEDYDEKFFETNGSDRLSKWLKSHSQDCQIISEQERLGPPSCRPSKLVCVGLNYTKHAKESGMKTPKEPVLFFKSTSALCGPYDDIIIPKNSKKTDWEVELAVLIKKKASYILEGEAMDYVFGYTIHNDVSEREFQLEREGQWVKGKSADTFAPLGPFLASTDEINDPQNLNLWLKINGEIIQNSNTNDMIFKIPYLVSYISQFMTLLPGDIISTGTPSGVGFGLKPPRYLNSGDVMELGIDGLGVARQRAVKWHLH